MRRRHALERVQLRILDAQLELRRAVARGDLAASDEDVRSTSKTLQDLARRLGDAGRDGDDALAKVITLAPRRERSAR
jgi:hypothetical protein